jgi:hypothetical protein
MVALFVELDRGAAPPRASELPTRRVREPLRSESGRDAKLNVSSPSQDGTSAPAVRPNQ